LNTFANEKLNKKHRCNSQKATINARVLLIPVSEPEKIVRQNAIHQSVSCKGEQGTGGEKDRMLSVLFKKTLSASKSTTSRKMFISKNTPTT